MSLPFPGRQPLQPSTYLVETFDLFLHNDEGPLAALQARFATFLRALDGPARLVTWHIPASLGPLIDWTVEEASRADDPWRAANLMQYRQWYEEIERAGDYQQALCGLALWAEG